eukprot:8732431-Pyramimonas_sp.AAC.1
MQQKACRRDSKLHHHVTTSITRRLARDARESCASYISGGGAPLMGRWLDDRAQPTCRNPSLASPLQKSATVGKCRKWLPPARHAIPAPRLSTQYNQHVECD